MVNPRKSRRVLRTAVATFALTTALAATAGTSAHAQYPPLPPTGGVGGAGGEVVAAAPVPQAPSAPAQEDLPATGNSMSTPLVAGGLALALGLGLTSWSKVAERRRSVA